MTNYCTLNKCCTELDIAYAELIHFQDEYINAIHKNCQEKEMYKSLCEKAKDKIERLESEK